MAHPTWRCPGSARRLQRLAPILVIQVFAWCAEGGLTAVTAGGPDLTVPPDATAEMPLRYGLGFPFQVSSTRAAVFCNVRVEGIAVVDYENGTDIVVFDDVGTVRADGAVAISRNERRIEDGTERIAVKFPVIGGVVPLGALGSDGNPHPHAGTGFGICQAISFPVDESGHFSWKSEMVHRCEIHQLRTDGEHVTALRSASGLERAHPGVGDSQWELIAPGISTAIPDGDDLLQPVTARGAAQVTGVVRWVHRDEGWYPAQFTPVSPEGEPWSEPSLVRDADGALLFTARGSGGDRFTEVRVWRFRDQGPQWRLVFSTEDVRVLHREPGGPEWRQIIAAPKARNSGPVSIGCTVDGTPFIGANLPGSGRETLCLWPLNAARSDLDAPVVARDARREFGAPPNGSRWMVDHPSSAVVRLRDGKWHGLLVYRILGQAEHRGAAAPPQSGCYIEEVDSSGTPFPPWRFE